MSESGLTEVQALCAACGFARKGKSFFRVWGDGVLQIVKYRRERAFQSDLICVGLFSLYGPLPPTIFTAPGSRAKYTVMNCYAQNAMPPFFAPPIQTQVDMLRNRVMPWLNSIDTQKELLAAINKLDRSWKDGTKIGPILPAASRTTPKRLSKRSSAIMPSPKFVMRRKEKKPWMNC